MLIDISDYVHMYTQPYYTHVSHSHSVVFKRAQELHSIKTKIKDQILEEWMGSSRIRI